VAWAGYEERGATDKRYDWVSGFERDTGCKVGVKTAATSDEMVALMDEGGFDLVTASGDASLRLISGGRVQEVNLSLVPSWPAVAQGKATEGSTGRAARRRSGWLADLFPARRCGSLGDDLAFRGLGHLRTSEVGEVLERTIRRMGKHLRRRGLLREDGDEDADGAETGLAASAVSGQAPPAGPQWVIRLRPLEPQPLAYDKPLCASRDGFTLHAATRADALHPSGREALLRYVLRPPIAQDKIEQGPDGLVRIVLKKPYADGTVAVDL
jgi:hypothetical protein